MRFSVFIGNTGARQRALMVDAGLIVLISVVSSFRSAREMARSLVGPREFIEARVDTSLALAEARDAKQVPASICSCETADDVVWPAS